MTARRYSPIGSRRGWSMVYPATHAATTEPWPRYAIPVDVWVFLLVALVIRLILAPLTEGWDFSADAHASALTLHGHDVYALARSAFHLPWTYFPLCLHLFTALQWVAGSTGWPFRVLGKLPTVAADLGIGYLLFMTLRRRGESEAVAVLGMALYLFNPLALLNGALLGRFDAIALVFALLSLEWYTTKLFAPFYGLAIAAKTFPIFLVPLLLLGRDRQKPGQLLLALLLVPLLALPYIATDPRGLLGYLFYDVHSPWLGPLSSYYIVPHGHPWPLALTMARAGTLLYPLALLLVAHRPLYVKAACTFVLFVALNRVVYEQYLVWALPFLIVVALRHRSRLALWLYALYTIAGVLESEQTWAPFDPRFHYSLIPTPWPPLSGLLAVSALLFVVTQALHGRARPLFRRRTFPAIPTPARSPRRGAALDRHAPGGAWQGPDRESSTRTRSRADPAKPRPYGDASRPD